MPAQSAGSTPRILVIDAHFYVEDLKSRNGTYVNGQQIHDRRRLEDNDRIKICDLLFTFHRTQPGTHPDGSSVGAEMVDDETDGTHSSTIMSKLDVTSSRDGLARTTPVNAEAKLRALLEINESLRSTISVEEVLPKILDSLFRVFLQADRGFVVLRDRENGPPGAEGRQTSPSRCRRDDSHQPHDHQPGNDDKRGDPLGRRRQRFAV